MAGDPVREIKEKIDIVDFISQYVDLKKSGKNYKALCPFHNEKTPSFMVSPDLQIWKCFGCGKAGDIFSFLMEFEGIDFREALESLAEKADVELTSYTPSPREERRKKLYELNDLAMRFFHYLLTEHKLGENALEYALSERGLSEELVRTFQLGYAPDSWSSLSEFLLSKDYTRSDIVSAGLAISKEDGKKFYDRFRGRLIFPLRDVRGRCVGFSGRVINKDTGPKYLNIPETPVFKKRAFLYGLYEARKYIRREEHALVVEGPTDLLSPFDQGYKNIVAAQGTSLTSGQIRLLKRYTDDVLICFDTDLAGNEAARRGITLAEKGDLNVHVILLPDKYKDPDECVRNDLQAWEEVLANPVSVYDFYFRLAQDKYDQYDPVGKKKISQELLPIIRDIPDAIEQAHYIEKLAKLLSVDKTVVRQALEKRNQPSGQADRGRQDPVDRVLNASANHGYPEKEYYMLRLLLLGSLSHVKSIVHRLGRKDFSHRALREFFSILKKYIQATEDFQISEFRDKIENNEDLLNILERLVFFELPLSRSQIEDELEGTLQKLKVGRTKRRLNEIQKEIKRREQEGDLEEVKELQKKFQDLSRKL
ncbi:MAG: DNA primase [Patescibacteria group bacterium]